MKLSAVLKKHRRQGPPSKHVYVWEAKISCACGWKSVRVPQFHPGREEPELMEQLRVDHEKHVEEFYTKYYS